MSKFLAVLISILYLSACSDNGSETSSEEQVLAAPDQAEEAVTEVPVVEMSEAESRLDNILMGQPEDVKARYIYRNPKETLEFIGIEPGMTVVEALPGGGWYSKILLQQLGSEGTLIGADYALDMFPLFGFFSEERLEAKKTWTTDWVSQAQGWGAEYDESAEVSAFVFGSMPESFIGTADAVLFIRALHNLNRFESKGNYITQALANTFQVLKPGGIVGVVQHEARAEMPDSWADGSKGYLKRDFLIAKMKEAGFEYVDSSDINQNPADQPTEDDIVWRLPPNFATSRDNPELKAQMQEIGESNRMTLKFKKPE